jgi:uncharacterized protein VirK/YbjX
MTPEEVSLIEEVITEDDITRLKTEAPQQRRYHNSPHCTVSITKMTSTEKKGKRSLWIDYQRKKKLYQISLHIDRQ